VTDRLGPRAYGITLLDAGLAAITVRGAYAIRIGRGHECEVQPVDAPESIVFPHPRGAHGRRIRRAGRA